MNNYEALIPISAFIATALVIIVCLYVSHKNKTQIQETIRLSLDKGDALTPELLESLGTSGSARVKDLRRGVILAAIGVACILGGLIANDVDAFTGFSIIGMFPLLVGSGFLLVWKLNRYND